MQPGEGTELMSKVPKFSYSQNLISKGSTFLIGSVLWVIARSEQLQDASKIEAI